MPDLNFTVERAEPVPHAAAPMLKFVLGVLNHGLPETAEESIHSVALRCQIRIEPHRRRYAPQEKEKLHDLFGEPARWGQTLKPMLWTHTSAIVQPFTGSTRVDLPVPCSYDFNLAATKYFDALEGDEIPLVLLFSGTIFYAGDDGMLQVAQIAWEKECTYRLPVQVWRAVMEHYYPNSAWLCLRKDVFDRVARYKSRHGLPTWEAALEKLLRNEEGEATA